MIHSDFRSSGCIAALRRLQAQMRADFGSEFRRVVVSTPAWLTADDFAAACDAASVRDAKEYERRFGRMSRFLATGELEQDATIPNWIVSACMNEHDPFDGVPIEGALAKCRVAFGGMLDAYARHRALAFVDVSSNASSAPSAPSSAPHQAAPQSAPQPSVADAARFARVCNDAYFAALWTDAHAQFAMHVVDNAPAPMRNVATRPSAHCTLGAPCVRLAASVSSLPALASEFEAQLAGRSAKSFPNDWSGREMLTLFARCTQSGSRGWEPSLKTALQASDLAKSVCSSALVACLIGMHPQIHPSCRPSCQERLLVRSVVESALATKQEDTLCQCSAAVKESVRLYMCSMLADVPATRAALAASGSVVGTLASAPIELTHPSLQMAARGMVKAGLHAAAAAAAAGSGGEAARLALIQELARCIGTETRSRKRPSPSTAVDGAISAPPPPPQPSCVASLLCRTPTDANAYAHSESRVRAVDVAHELMMRSFRMQFVPVWMHAHGYGVRASRLDPCQQRHIHSTAPSHLVTSLLDDGAVLRVQRMVADDARSYFTSVAKLAERVGADAATAERLAACPTVESAVLGVTEQLTPTQGALFLTYCKIASLKEKLLCYDLGEITKERQLRALRLRFDLHTSTDVERDLPHHAKFLYVCMECGRVPNACVDVATSKVPHNEVGLSQTMFRVGALGCESDVRCAKRSSAALRTALGKEEEAMRQRIDQREVSDERMANALGHNGDVSQTARLRRDVKSCAEQQPHAFACGDSAMVKVPLIGHCVRIQGKWYAICSCCGSVLRVDQSMRFGTDLCCNRCDPTMLGPPPDTEEAAAVVAEVAASAATKGTSSSGSSGSSGGGSASSSSSRGARASVGKELSVAQRRQLRATDPAFLIARDSSLPCRFCGKPPPSGGSTSRFKIVRSPNDTSGKNARLPPPLRTVAYCSAHFRPWVENAHQSMSSKIILAHISEKATPVFGAETGRRNNGELLQLTHVRPARGRSSSTAASIEKRMRANRRATTATQ